MTAPATVAVRDAIRTILRDRPIEMSCWEIARLLDPQLVQVGQVLRCRKLSQVEVYRQCEALVADGYLVGLAQEHTTPARFMWLPPQPGTHRERELVEHAEFAALASMVALGADEEPTT